MSTEDTVLLHNMGGPPKACIVWRGWRDLLNGSNEDRIAIAGKTGSWLRLQISIGQRNRTYRRDWNSASALLELLQPGHGLPEAEAGARLAERIEAHCQRLNWPHVLLVREPGPAIGSALVLDHPLTTFVALAKSTGTIWMRERTVRLAPLQSPTLVEPGGTPMRGVQWSTTLWFPNGIPDNLLDKVRTQLRKKERI